MLLTIPNASVRDVSAVFSAKSNKNHQKFEIQYDPDLQNYMIVNVNSGKALEYSYDTGEVYQRKQNLYKLAQRWYIFQNDDGTYAFCSAANTDKYMYLTASGEGDTISLCMSEKVADNTQKFVLAKTVNNKKADIPEDEKEKRILRAGSIVKVPVKIWYSSNC